MRRYREHKDLKQLTFGLIVGIVVIIVLLMILPIDIVYRVPVMAKVYPSKEWKVNQQEGEYFTSTVSRTGEHPGFERTFVFERGDVVDVTFPSHLKAGGLIQEDSTILTFTSQMLNLRIQQALNERDIQYSLVRAGETAMKVPLYNEAVEALDLAASNLELQNRNLERLQELYQEGVVSKFELDVQTNAQRVAEQEWKMAARRMESTTFEIKPEDVEVFSTQMTAADNELDVLLRQQQAYTIRSPFSGVVKIAPQEGVVLSVRDTSVKSVVFPFPVSERPTLLPNSTLVIEGSNGQMELPFSLREDAAMIGGGQHVLGVAVDERIIGAFGEVTEAYVLCDTISLSDYLLRKLN